MEEKYNILIINNDENEIAKIKKLLSPFYSIESMCDPIEAVEKLNNDKSKFSLIITSLILPEMNGYELCLNLKKDINIREVQVIIIGNPYDYHRIEQPDGLRSSEYEKIVRPFKDKTLMDLIEINIEKQAFLKKLELKSTVDESTGLYNNDYFKTVLNYELIRCSKLNLTLNCLEIGVHDTHVKENLLSMIKNVCRYYDIATVISNRLLLLLPNTTEGEGEKIFNRLCSLIFGLKMNIYFYDPAKSEESSFKKKILG